MDTGVYAGLDQEIVGIGVAYAVNDLAILLVRTKALHDPAVFSPVLRPISHVVVRGFVQTTERAEAFPVRVTHDHLTANENRSNERRHD